MSYWASEAQELDPCRQLHVQDTLPAKPALRDGCNVGGQGWLQLWLVQQPALAGFYNLLEQQ